ncbi:MAG TPA: zincin-like metallopeptidase domain-containing protein [Flavobacterium sp.]|jgi:antirestriction protein ArdC
MDAVQEFNGLHGAEVTREEISSLIIKARNEEQFHLATRLEKLLSTYDDQVMKFEIERPAFETVPQSLLRGLDYENDHEGPAGLGKAVSPDEIYSYVTDLIINTIKKVGHLPWQKNWTGSGAGGMAKNYVSKKEYTGANWLLNFEVQVDENGEDILVPIKFIQPYYLTFNQIREAKASLKKGSSASRVIYYTMIFDYESEYLKFKTSGREKFAKFVQDNGLTASDLKRNLQTIPVLKYYNVFRADDCTGLKFDDAKPAKKVDPIEAAQAIIDGYKDIPKVTYGGDGAYYMPSKDTINMPHIEAFSHESAYYSTFFHEMVHSTGVEKRLDRDMTGNRKGNEAARKSYAFEELIAELGAAFGCSEAGILFLTRENTAKYLHSWNSRLVGELENDSRFFLKASAQAQKAINYIMDRNVAQPAVTAAKKLSPAKSKMPAAIPAKKAEPTAAPITLQTFIELAKTSKTAELFHRAVNKIQNVPAEVSREIRKLYGKGGASPLEASTRLFDKVHKIKTIAQHAKDQVNKTHKVKKDLDKLNPKPFANKPKSVSVATAIKEVLALSKYKGIGPLPASIIYKTFKKYDPASLNSEDFILISSDYELAILTKETPLHWIYDDELTLTGKGVEFVKAVSGRLESLHNQKNNYAMFPLNGAGKRGLKSPDVSDLIQPETTVLPEPEVKPVVTVQPGSTTPAPKPIVPAANIVPGSLADQLSRPKAEFETYKIVSAEIRKLLGDVEIKNKESVLITLAGEKGSMKTRLLFQLMNDLAQNYKSGHASIEEHPESKVYVDKAVQYLNAKAMNNITAPEINNLQDLDKLIMENEVIFIDSFAKLREIDSRLEVDKDLRKKYHGKLFIVIFQQTGDGKMRGGSKSEFDGDIILLTETFPDYRENYCYPTKHRYSDTPLDQLKFNIFQGKMLEPAPVATPITAEPIKLSFTGIVH